VSSELLLISLPAPVGSLLHATFARVPVEKKEKN
jgi:hypothetical protein